MKRAYLWVYEYKDDDTPIGATLLRCPIDEIPEENVFPHLSGDWHICMDIVYEDEEDNKGGKGA